jgi:rhodanese-related sulfurtransferase
MVLVFSDNVNKSQAVLNEINLAAGANVTIVPFRIASVEFNPELNYYLGRTHWLDAFPQPVDAYIDALAATIQRNLPPTPAADAAPAAPATPPPAAPVAAPPAAVATPPPAKTNYMPLLIIVAVFAFVLVIVLVATHGPGPSPAQEQATKAISQALANAIQTGAKDDDDDRPPQVGPAGAPQPPRGDGSELAPVGQPNPGAVTFYENELQPGGPPAALQGATVINTVQLLQNLRARDAGAAPFWLVDARGCTQETTLPTAICLTSNSLQELEAKAPGKATQLVIFCHDGACPMSFNLASQAVAAGYTDVLWYRGGVNAWAASGEPTVSRAGGGP